MAPFAYERQRPGAGRVWLRKATHDWGPRVPSLRLELLWQMLHNVATDQSVLRTVATGTYQVRLQSTPS